MNMRQKSQFVAVRGHAKKAANWIAKKINKGPLFDISVAERIATLGVIGFPNKQLNAVRKWMIWGFRKTLIGWSLLLFLVLYLIAQVFGRDVGAENLWTEFWGLIFDVLVILVGFGLIQNWKQKRDVIDRQYELIEDLKRWDSEEARHRILGAIRRLNNINITKIDLAGCRFGNASFKKDGVIN